METFSNPGYSPGRRVIDLLRSSQLVTQLSTTSAQSDAIITRWKTIPSMQRARGCDKRFFFERNILISCLLDRRFFKSYQ